MRLLQILMASIQNDLHFFGLDLRNFGRNLLVAWRGLGRSKLLSWLTPQHLVRLNRADDSVTGWTVRGTMPCWLPAARTESMRFDAVELPEDLFLLREFNMPALPDEQVGSAVRLEVQNASPFSFNDVAWGYGAWPSHSGLLRVRVAIASRKQVESFLLKCRASSGSTLPINQVGGEPEVWAVVDRNTPSAVILAGFGEARRRRQAVMGRRLGLALLILLFCLITAVAISPTAQLRLRAINANIEHAALAERTRPLIAKREALTKAAEQLVGFQEIRSSSIDVPEVMARLTGVLPDDTSLSMLQLDGRKVSIQGQTDNAASLMKRLSGQPGLLDVTAPSPAVKQLGATKESFRIDFVLDLKGAQNEAAASPVPTSVLPLDAASPPPKSSTGQ